MLIIFYDDGISEIADTAFDTAFVQIDRSLATPLQLNLNQAVLLSFQDKVECAGVFSVFFFFFLGTIHPLQGDAGGDHSVCFVR